MTPDLWPFQLLDGPIGTELAARGVDTSLPLWSARGVLDAPAVVAEIHAEYARAGATIHTANTFRTKARTVGDGWRRVTREAVALARSAVGNGRVAGSISPLEDCYRPDLSPPDAEVEHRPMAGVLASAGCDLLLVETFPHAGEAIAATRAAVATGLPTWVALTAGPEADLMTPAQMADAARAVVSEGAAAVLVNCVPATKTMRYLETLSRAGVPFGAYANAGSVDDRIGWQPPDDPAVERYCSLARTWLRAGATIVGGCCGTGPAHIAALAELRA